MSHGRPAAGDGSAGPLRTAPLEARMRILHPTDFSRTAEKALTVARDLKERLGGTLHVVHVQTRFEETLGLVRLRPHLDSVNPELERRLEEARQEEVRRLNDMLRSLASPDGTYELRWGEPLQELLEMQGDFDLVVMGAHGSNRIDRYFLGGVAGRFVRRTRVPVITVREECQVTSVRRALVATDFSEAAHGAVEAAKGLGQHGVRLVLCHVVDDPRFRDDPTYMSTVTDALDLLGDGFERHAIRYGDPAEELPAAAQEVGADLIVIGLKQQRGAVGLLLGSRVDALIRSSAVPVLAVPTEVD